MDICACQDKKCPSRKLCFRFTCVKDTYQSYFAKSPRKKGAVSCTEFWANSSKCVPCHPTEPECCRCELFGMKHKRTSACEVFEVITMPKLRSRVNRTITKNRMRGKK